MARGKNGNRSGFKKFLIFTGISLLIIAVVGGVIYWQWDNIADWLADVTVGITQLFGWGLILVVLAILTFLVVIFSNPNVLIRYWNRWIGLLILA